MDHEEYRDVNMIEAGSSKSSIEFSHETHDNGKFSDDQQDTILNWKERALQLEKGLNIYFLSRLI